LYGPNDNYDLNNSHVIPALLRKFHEAKINNSAYVEVWGSGKPLREFMHVDDLAAACLFLINHYNNWEYINIGSGLELSIRQLAETISSIVQYQGEISWISDKPDGVFRKLMDSSRMRDMGWQSSIELVSGITDVYRTLKWN
jgi:GDP-L-fucose synthase